MRLDNMTSEQAIEQGFIPYPYTFPAIQFVVVDDDDVDLDDDDALDLASVESAGL
jgi:hypothetical protein